MAKAITALPPESHKPGKYWPLVKWFLIVFGIVLLLYLTTLPVRGRLSERYQESGDRLLLEKHYIAAQLEYKKALILRSSNTEAKTGESLAKRAALDIRAMEGLAQKQQKSELVSLFNQAKSVPKNEVEAAQLSRSLIEKGEYQMAIIPAETATQMDKTYRDGWIYLGIANLQSARQIELSNDIQSQYLKNAQIALEKAKELDPTYAPTEEWLKQVKG